MWPCRIRAIADRCKADYDRARKEMWRIERARLWARASKVGPTRPGGKSFAGRIERRNVDGGEIWSH